MKYGLDFGTTNTSIAIAQNNTGKVLAIDATATDPRVVRTLLYFLRRAMTISKNVPEKRLNNLTFMKGELSYKGDQEYMVGAKAVAQYLADNNFRKPGIIRKILTGKMVSLAPGSDPVLEYYLDIDDGIGRFLQSIKTALKSPHYKGTSIFGEFYTLEDLIAAFVSEIKKRADAQLGEKINEVVVGRPVHFSDEPDKDLAAQKRLEQALQQVGFEKITFVYEPVAAAEQFIATTGRKKQLVFVFDFGGGTLDTAIVKAGDTSEVLAADGVYIGGDLLNADIVQAKLWEYFGYNASWGDHGSAMPRHIFDSLKSWFSIPQLNNPQSMQMFETIKYNNSDPAALERLVYLIKANLGFNLYEAIEQAKKSLSFSDVATISFHNNSIAIETKITKAEFEEIIKPRVKEIKAVILRTLKTANLEPSEIDVVVRTGGSSLIPVFENLLGEIFGKQKITKFETFTSIASGLSLTDVP